jgi:4'-phosphopantetheinyl transferase
VIWNGVDVWRIQLARSATEVAALESMLDSAERCRASMFRFERDRSRFVVAHAALRSILGEYAGVEPRRVNLSLRSGGKPVMSCDGMTSTLHFNLSHSGDLALCAVSDREVGVDCERLRCHEDIERVARQFFSSDETHALKRRSGIDQTRFFFRTWVRKEAYVKATGEGLACDTTSFTVENCEAGMTVHDGDGRGRTDDLFCVYDLPDVDDYFAAIALSGVPSLPGVEYRDWLS